jgi:cellulose synthase/poly-beta-1,6-N-acetylglucosamine synthase-like glycosyltransferase
MRISILIPCHNEGKSIRKCVQSCLDQTRPPDQVLVINDGSSDNSGEILATFGDAIEVLTIPKATGNKSRAQERGLAQVTGDIFIATDGDTTLDPGFVAAVEERFADEEVMALGGYVKSLPFNWLTACRELDYIIGQDLFKRAQDTLNAMFVIPGCAGAFRTQLFTDKYITFEHDTLTEDLDFTYRLHKQYLKVVYDRRAISFTQDPARLSQYINQMRRWYGGGWQNLRKHWHIIQKPNSSFILSLMYFEGVIFSVLIFVTPLFYPIQALILAGLYVCIMLLVGVYGSITRRRLDLIMYAPLYIVLSYLHAGIFLEQFWKEIVRGETNLVWFHPERREIT